MTAAQDELLQRGTRGRFLLGGRSVRRRRTGRSAATGASFRQDLGWGCCRARVGQEQAGGGRSAVPGAGCPPPRPVRIRRRGARSTLRPAMSMSSPSSSAVPGLTTLVLTSRNPLASGSAGRHNVTATPSTPRNAGIAEVSCGRPDFHDPIAPSLSHTNARGTAAHPANTAHIRPTSPPPCGRHHPPGDHPGVPGDRHQHRIRQPGQRQLNKRCLVFFGDRPLRNNGHRA
jgi:hypothetical protein